MSSKIEDLKDERVPPCLYWTVDDVAKWIEEIGFPDYKDCIYTNFIDGKRLICVDSSALPKIGITDFMHIQEITKGVRDLLTIENPFWNRSISLPPREQLGLYLERKSKTGKEMDSLTFSKFLTNVDELKWQPPLTNHGLLLPTQCD